MSAFTKTFVGVFVIFLFFSALILASRGDWSLAAVPAGIAIFFVVVSCSAVFDAKHIAGQAREDRHALGIFNGIRTYWKHPSWQGKFFALFFALFFFIIGGFRLASLFIN